MWNPFFARWLGKRYPVFSSWLVLFVAAAALVGFATMKIRDWGELFGILFWAAFIALCCVVAFRNLKRRPPSGIDLK